MKFQKNLTLLLLLAFCMAWVNCSDDDSSGLDPNDPSTFIGTWSVVSLNDKAGDLCGCTLTPGTTVMVDFGGVMVELTFESGTIVLTADTYVFTLNLTIAGLAQPATSTGTWSLSGNQFTIDPDDDDPDTGSFTIDGNRVTIDTPAQTLVIEKQ